MNRIYWGVIAALLSQTAIAKPLTEPEAVSRTLSNVAFRTSLAAEQKAAAAKADGAGRWSNPEIEWNREHLSASNRAEDLIVLSQKLDISGRLGLAGDAAKTDTDAVADRQRRARSRRASVARRTFFRVLFEQHRYEVLRQWRGQLARLATAVRARANAGDAPAYEARRLEAQLSRTDANLVIATTKREVAWTDLVILMGQSANSNDSWPRVEGSLLPKPPESLKAVPRYELENRGDLAALEAEQSAAAVRATAAGRWWIPNLSLHGGYKGADGIGDREHGFVLGVGVELPLLDRAQGEQEMQTAIAQRVAAERELLLWAARQRIRERSEAASKLFAAAKMMRDGPVGSAHNLVRTAEASYLAGELGVVELLDAHRNAIESNLETLELEHAARMAVIDLDREMGVVP